MAPLARDVLGTAPTAQISAITKAHVIEVAPRTVAASQGDEVFGHCGGRAIPFEQLGNEYGGVGSVLHELGA